MKLFTILLLTLTLIYSSCESFQDGPLAVTNEQEDLYKQGQNSTAGKQVKVSKAIYEGCQTGEICWNNGDFNLPDFDLQAFTITSVEVCIVSDNETAHLSAEMFGQICSSPISDCQLATTLCWEGEYPEEHPFYKGFNIHISSSEVLETVEAVCSITYIIH